MHLVVWMDGFKRSWWLHSYFSDSKILKNPWSKEFPYVKEHFLLRQITCAFKFISDLLWECYFETCIDSSRMETSVFFGFCPLYLALYMTHNSKWNNFMFKLNFKNFNIDINILLLYVTLCLIVPRLWRGNPLLRPVRYPT